MLRSLKRNYVTQILGCFDVEFDDRELDEDKKFKVLMLQKLHARPLTRIHPSALRSTERNAIRNAVIDIVKSMHENDIYFPSPYLPHFLMMIENHSTVRVCSLGTTYHPSEYSLSKEEQDGHKRRAIVIATDELDEAGWC